MAEIKEFSRAALRQEKPFMQAVSESGMNTKDVYNLLQGKRTVAEFIGTGDFAAAWVERQRYEVWAGRDQEPLLYQPIYETVQDRTLPRTLEIYRMGGGGVVFEEVQEGGEVKFGTVSSEKISLTQKHYAVALEYTKDLMIFNELFQVARFERQAGIAYNALMNHIHFDPILTATYGADNQTAASAVGSTLIEKYANTILDAMESSSADSTYHRNGPYAILCHPSVARKIQRSLSYNIQDGNDTPIIGASDVQAVIAYDGWVGTRGNKTTTYTGVTATKAYLIDLSKKPTDFLSYEKQPLEMAMGNPDMSRFIMDQTIWDTYIGVYSNPLAAVEEITLPT